MPLLQHMDAVRTLHAKLDNRTAHFARTAGLCCPSGCGACCANPAIDASPLDVLPLAQALIDQGLAEKTLAEIGKTTQNHCYFFAETAPGQGYCTQYNSRPSLCRLFGYCGRRNKYGVTEAVPCRVLKTSFEQKIAEAPQLLDQLPTFNEARAELQDIDPSLASVLPLPQAVQVALEKLLLETSLAHV